MKEKDTEDTNRERPKDTNFDTSDNDGGDLQRRDTKKQSAGEAAVV